VAEVEDDVLLTAGAVREFEVLVAVAIGAAIVGPKREGGYL